MTQEEYDDMLWYMGACYSMIDQIDSLEEAKMMYTVVLGMNENYHPKQDDEVETVDVPNYAGQMKLTDFINGQE